MTDTQYQSNGLTASQILPEDALNEGIQLRDELDGNAESCWRVADRSIELIEELAGTPIMERHDDIAYHRTLRKGEIRAAWADIVNLSPNSLRVYELTSKTFDQDDRDLYSAWPLTHSDFRRATRAPDPHEFLDWIVKSADDFGGTPAPARVQEARLKELNGNENTERERFESDVNAIESAVRRAQERHCEQSPGEKAKLAEILERTHQLQEEVEADE